METFESRRRFIRGAVALPLIYASRLTQARGATSSGLLARMRAAKSATIGVANFPPYSAIEPDGTLTGAVPDLGKVIMTRLGVPELKALAAGYGQLIPGMLAGRWDFICTAMTINKARCTQVLFSDPVIFDGPTMISLKGTLVPPPKRVADLVARKLVIGVSAGGAIARLSLAAGVNLSDMRQFTDDVAMVDALVAKRVQVVFQDHASLMRVVNQRRLPVDVTYPVVDAPEHGSGCAFRTNDADLYAAFQKELRAMKASGEYLSIVRRYGFNTPPDLMAITAERACATA